MDACTILIRVTLSMLFLVLAIVTHIILKTYYNVSVCLEKWDREKFKEGFYKLAIIFTGTYLMSIMSAYFPVFLAEIGIPISESVTEYLNITTILLIMIKPTIVYVQKNIETLQAIVMDILPDKPDAGERLQEDAEEAESPGGESESETGNENETPAEGSAETENKRVKING